MRRHRLSVPTACLAPVDRTTLLAETALVLRIACRVSASPPCQKGFDKIEPYEFTLLCVKQ